MQNSNMPDLIGNILQIQYNIKVKTVVPLPSLEDEIYLVKEENGQQLKNQDLQWAKH